MEMLLIATDITFKHNLKKISFHLSPHFLSSVEISVQFITNKKYLGGLVGQSET